MEQYAVERVDTLLKSAIELKASDVHLEPMSAHAQVRMRVDGILSVYTKIEYPLFEMVVARLKVLAGMNVAQKRLAQDGKYIYQNSTKTIDIRVSTFPTIFGEKVVLRVLNTAVEMIDFEQLGMTQALAVEVAQFLQRPTGFFIVTGPTGSGKTTTLYAFLKKLNNQAINIVTLEDPVEYTLQGVTQTQIHTEIGLTFDTGIRSLLRQDPDVIFIGEVRDKQTAKTAIEAALTGHLVFTTMHTVDSASAVVRLYDMDIDPFLIEGALSGVIAQRLVRALCQQCKKIGVLAASEQALLSKMNYQGPTPFIPAGCTACGMSGYMGRIGIFEYLPITINLRHLLSSKPSYETLLAYVKEQNIACLKDSAFSLVAQGRTSVREIIRTVTVDM